MNTHIIPSDHLYILSGPSASGKSSFTQQLIKQGLPPDAIVSTDNIRKNILGSFKDADEFGIRTSLYGWEMHNHEIFSIINQILDLRLKQKLPTILDAVNINDSVRKEYVEIANKNGMPVTVVIFDIEKDVLKERLSKRQERFDFSVVENQLQKFQRDSKYPYLLVKPEDVFLLVPNLLSTTKLDVIGDSHGLLDELQQLLKQKNWVLNYSQNCFEHHDKERKLIFLGDIVDRGTQSIDLLRVVKNTVEQNRAELILGNHEAKLISSYERYKKEGIVSHKSLSSSQTLVDFLKLSLEEKEDIFNFLLRRPIKLSLWIDKDTGFPTNNDSNECLKIGFCHADNHHFDEYSLPKSFALYGSKENIDDADKKYEENYLKGINKHILIRGHIPNTSNQAHVYSLDDGQAFEGNLALLSIDDYLEKLKENNWNSTHQFFVENTIKYKTSFNFDKYVEKKIMLLKEMDKLVKDGLATDGWRKDESGKKQPHPDGLKIFKYSKQVHFKRLWKTNPWLEKARGLVLDSAGNIVVHPFDKLYNFGEYDVGQNLPKEKRVQVIEKLNGFLGCISKHPFKNELLPSTTGSVADDAPFVKMIKDFITPELNGRLLNFFNKNNLTLMFEVIHPEDPHIIEYDKKDHGLWLIGARKKELDAPIETEDKLDQIAQELGLRRPKWEEKTFEKVLESLQNSELEGFMIRDGDTQEPLMKIKTNYYLVTKFVGRMGKNMVKMMFNHPEQFKEQKVDEEFYPIVDKIISKTSEEKFNEMPQEQRVIFVRQIVNETRQEFLEEQKKVKNFKP